VPLLLECCVARHALFRFSIAQLPGLITSRVVSCSHMGWLKFPTLFRCYGSDKTATSFVWSCFCRYLSYCPRLCG
jgi:hypothetical protein